MAAATELQGAPSPNIGSMYSSEWVFLHRLLEDATHRVASPEDADLFIVPTFAWNHAGPHGGPVILERIELLVAFLKSTPPASTYWARRGGADFVIWANGDLGACTLPAHLRSFVVAAEYGHTDLRRRNGDAPEVQPCMTGLRGVVVPTTAPAVPLLAAERTYGNGSAVRARDTLLFFSGTVIDDRSYSQHVRWEVLQLWANVSDSYVRDSKHLPPGEAPMGEDVMLERMRGSRFCLAPSGHGFGVRITFSMLTGCVPVVIQDGVRQPLDDVLPYWRFSLRLAQADIPHLERILRAVTPDELAVLQAGVERYHPYFVWCTSNAECAAAGGRARAYHGVLESLHRKLYNAAGGFASL